MREIKSERRLGTKTGPQTETVRDTDREYTKLYIHVILLSPHASIRCSTTCSLCAVSVLLLLLY